MPANKLSLNIFLSCLEDRGFDVTFYYDRVKLYATSANKKAKLERICPDEERQKIISRRLLHYDDMSLMIDAHQPEDTSFFGFKNALTGNYVINYAEFAMDIIGENKRQVAKLMALLNKLVIFERRKSRKKSHSYFYYSNGEREGKKGGENTHYFGQRYKHKDILVIYSDMSSKVDGKSHCVHVEMRLYGSKILKNFGIYTIQDLIDFRHETIWDKYLDLRDVNYTKLGRLVTEEKAGLTDSSLIRHGQSYLNKFVGSQALLMEHPNFVTAFAPIKDRRMFESRLDKALR